MTRRAIELLAPFCMAGILCLEFIVALFSFANENTSVRVTFDGRLRPVATGITEAYMPALYPSSHAANLIALQNGDVLCFWFSGTAEGASDVGIVMSRLTRGSSQWTTPTLIDHQKGYSYQNPVPFQSHDGTLWLFHTRQPANQGQANSEVLWLKSNDNGHTWSAPSVLIHTPGSFLRDPPVLTADGDWLLPMYYTPTAGIISGAESHYSVMMISSDRGKTWKSCPVPHSNGYVQPSVVRIADHSYVAFFRSRFADWIYRSESKDGCRWSDPQQTVLPNNNASIQALKLKDGRIAMVFDDSSADQRTPGPKEGPRKPLAIALSDDNGKNWPYRRVLEAGQKSVADSAREEYSYPSIIQDPSGEIDVAYTYLRKTIKFVRFSERWVLSGPRVAVTKR